MVAQLEEVPSVVCTRFQVFGSDFSPVSVKHIIPPLSMNCSPAKDKTMTRPSAGHRRLLVLRRIQIVYTTFRRSRERGTSQIGTVNAVSFILYG